MATKTTPLLNLPNKNEDVLYIDVSAARAKQQEIKTDFNNIIKTCQEINKTVKLAQSDPATKGQFSQAFTQINKGTRQRVKWMTVRNKQLQNNINSAIQTYSYNLLEKRLSELEATISRLETQEK